MNTNWILLKLQEVDCFRFSFIKSTQNLDQAENMKMRIFPLISLLIKNISYMEFEYFVGASNFIRRLIFGGEI